MIWEFERLGLQYPIISIFGTGTLKIYQTYYLVELILFNIQAEEGSYLHGARQKIPASGFLIFWFSYTGFYCFSYGMSGVNL